MAFFRAHRSSALWRVDQYRGERSIDVEATQLESHGITKHTEQQKVLADWIEFLAASTTRVTRLNLVSRVPQDLLDAVAGQPQLESLHLKWGPYSDLSAVSYLTGLRTLSLGGARAVTDLQPLRTLDRLETLVIDQPFSVGNPEPIGALRTLKHLSYGNGHLGSDRTVEMTELEWIGNLTNLRTLHLPGTRLPADQLPVLRRLPKLIALQIPLRRAYRKVVFDAAPTSKVFARLAKEYEGLDAGCAAAR